MRCEPEKRRVKTFRFWFCGFEKTLANVREAWYNNTEYCHVGNTP